MSNSDNNNESVDNTPNVPQPNLSDDVLGLTMEYCTFKDLVSLTKLNKCWHRLAGLFGNPRPWVVILYYQMCDLDLLPNNDTNILFTKYANTQWYNDFKYYNKNILFEMIDYDKNKVINDILPLMAKKVYYWRTRRNVCAQLNFPPRYHIYDMYFVKHNESKPYWNKYEKWKKDYGKIVSSTIEKQIKKVKIMKKFEQTSFVMKQFTWLISMLNSEIPRYNENNVKLDQLITEFEKKKERSLFESTALLWGINIRAQQIRDKEVKLLQYCKETSSILHFLCLSNWMDSTELNQLCYNDENDNCKNWKKYDYFINETMLKWILKYFGDKMGDIYVTDQEKQNFKFEPSGEIATWIELFLGLLRQTAIQLGVNGFSTIDHNSLFRYIGMDNLEDAHLKSKLYEKTFYQFSMKNVICARMTEQERKQKWFESVGIYRCGVISSMFIFGNKRFSYNKNTISFFDNLLNKFCDNVFGCSIGSFVFDSYYHKMMIVLDYILSDKDTKKHHKHGKYDEWQRLFLYNELLSEFELNKMRNDISDARRYSMENCILDQRLNESFESRVCCVDWLNDCFGNMDFN